LKGGQKEQLQLSKFVLGRCGDWTVDQARAKARQLAIDFSSPDYLSSEVIKGVTPTFYEAVKLHDELILSQKSKNYRDKNL
jgi:5-hydroxyisourate hydrolase-like protein (transthyretin family)